MSAALLRTATAEYAGLHMRIVDPGPGPISASALAAEIGDPGHYAEIAWRGGRRLERLLAPAAAEGPGIVLETAGHYLVTGGLGGVGQRLANWLQARKGARLTLLGRRAEARLAPQTAAALGALRRQGQVEYIACDLADGAATGAALRGFRCDGVFHLAGVATPAAIADLTAEDLAEVLAVKCAGSETLRRLLPRIGAGWMVNFASLNGTFGGPQFAAYAMANRYQQAMATTAPALRTLSWSMWQGVGASADYAATALTRRRGYQLLSPDAALEALEPALASGAASVHIGIDPDQPAIAAELDIPARRLAVEELVPPRAGAPVGHQPETTPAAAGWAAAFCAIWKEVLELADKPSDADDIFDLGATSLELPRAQRRLSDVIGREIDILDLFRFPVISDLVEELAQPC